MLTIPSALRAQFEGLPRNRMVPDNAQSSYPKWLRFYLDFCWKYHLSHAQKESLAQFLRKLHQERQTEAQQQQASHAITLYYELIHSRTYHNDEPSINKVSFTTETSNE
jgi:hypothetical protein